MFGLGQRGNHKAKGKGTQLLDAAITGDKAKVLDLLAEGADVGAKDNDGWTPLHNASYCGHADVGEALLAKGADVDAKDKWGRTPLHWASSNGHADVAEALLSKGADIKAKNKFGRTPLHGASSNGHADVAILLLSKRADMEVKDNGGATPLHGASSEGHADVAEALLTKGANVEAKDNYGRTPLHNASSNGHADVVKTLLARGADVEAKDEYGRTPLHLARNGKDSVVKLLEDAFAGRSTSSHVKLLDRKAKELAKGTQLLYATRTGDKVKVLDLLSKGVDIEAKDKYGRTPLHHSSSKGHADVAEALLSKGADVEAKDKNGKTPLHNASFYGHAEVAKLLLAKGAAVEAKDNDGKTPINIAKSHGKDSIVKLLELDSKANELAPEEKLLRAARAGDKAKVLDLLSEGADIEAKDNDGDTPLHWASYYGHTDVAEVLLAKGADVKAKDNDGWMPLHNASCNGHANVAEALLAKGADIEAKDNDGRTPLHNASRNGHADVAELLLAKGAAVEAKDNDGKTPINIAKFHGKDSIMKLLELELDKFLEDAFAGRSTPSHPTSANGVSDFPKSPTDSSYPKLTDKDRIGNESDVPNPPTDQVHMELTGDDYHFLSIGRKLVRDGGDIPVISKEERLALQALTTNIVDFERSLESVRELPSSLAGKDPKVANYFFFFTSAFERTYVAAQALSSGAVKVDMADDMLEALLGGASWVAEKSGLPFVGCISIFSTIISHQRSTKKINTFMAFSEFFHGNSRDQYLLTYRKLAEQFCLQLEISSFTKNDPGIKGNLNNIVEPIRKHLRKSHLDTIQKLSPVEEKAMADLASLTKEVLRLHQGDHDTYCELRTSNEFDKASYFTNHIFGMPSISSCLDKKSPNNGSTQIKSCKPSARQSLPYPKNDELAQLLEEHKKQLHVNANMAQVIKQTQAQVRKLAAKVASQKDVIVSDGQQAQAQLNPNRPKEETQQLEHRLRVTLEQFEKDLHQVQIQQEKQSRDVEKMKLENFINNRDLSFHEAFDFTRKILSMARDNNGNEIRVSDDGLFALNGKDLRIGEVRKGRPISKKKTLWKGKVVIKLEEEHQGIKSIMDWFDETKLRPLYERYKKVAIHIMFAEELDKPCLPDMAKPYQHPYLQGDRDELFDASPGLR